MTQDPPASAPDAFTQRDIDSIAAKLETLTSAEKAALRAAFEHADAEVAGFASLDFVPLFRAVGGPSLFGHNSDGENVAFSTPASEKSGFRAASNDNAG